jgi:hypothetical protein
MDFKELFGEEMASNIEKIAEEKGIKLLVDQKEQSAYVEKKQLDDLLTQINAATSEKETLTSQLEELKKEAAKGSNLSKEIETLKLELSKANSNVSTVKLDYEIKSLAKEFKAHDVADILPFLNKEAISIEKDGSVKGIKEQIEKLVETKPYLFTSVTEGTGGSKGNVQRGNSTNTNTNTTTKGGIFEQLLGLKNKK